MAFLTELAAKEGVWIYSALIGILVYTCWSLIYNVYFHPLSKFPGSKLATCSFLHEFYYDVICRGMFIWEIGKMHDKYGPIVRINPRELHIKDPDFFDEVYATGNRKREKDPKFVPALVSPHAMIATSDHDHHRVRKNILKHFFSRRSLEGLGPFIQDTIQVLCEKLKTAHENDSVVQLDMLYADLTADTITHYSFGKSYNYMQGSAATNDIQSGATEVTVAFHVNRFFPIFRRIFDRTPIWLIKAIRPKYSQSVNLLSQLREQSEAALQHTGAKTSTKTIFDALADPSVPAEERTLPRLMDEGFVVLGAGTITTARTLAMASFQMFSHKEILFKLREELKPIMPSTNSQPTWAQLERLPYLSGIIYESLRLTHGVLFRQPRIAPDESLKFQDWIIPPGTPVAISTYLTHMDPNIFPDPEAFRPERWIEAKEQGFPLHKYLIAFSKGSRQCLGMALAYFEMYLTLAHVARKFDMELYDTTERNLEIGRDLGISYPVKGPYHVKAKITDIVNE
ncbi:hypothetical protein N7523_002303 [Penicillium sp. IBT 18751x]|nr:hypothetical protein N7523_002303 [Penicillium sp. IBT 18751x]